MDEKDYTTEDAPRKRGKHLTKEERGMIEALHRLGLSLRKIASQVGCSHTTVHNELKRGTPEKKGKVGRTPIYKAARGQKAYESNRQRCRKKGKAESPKIEPFVKWAAEKVRKEKWSLDVCCGVARKENLFAPDTIPCTKTMYNMLHRRQLPLTLFDVSRAVSWKQKRRVHLRNNKRVMGRSIEERPDSVNRRDEIGHWEADTVVGKKKGKESVILTLTERATRMAIAVKIPSKSREGMEVGIKALLDEYGAGFPKVFRSITCDNGAEFSGFSGMEKYGVKAYFAHPYSSYERGQNERFNCQLRQFIPEGKSIEDYSEEDILGFADAINSTPRRILGYNTPEYLFDKFLDTVYAL